MEYIITNFGAAGDGKTLATTCIQRAIDYAASHGGGVVVVPSGTFLTGAIFLRRQVSLRIDGILLGSSDINQYPFGPTRFEGHTETWPCALLNAEGLDGFLLYGKGTLDGDGIPFYQKFWDARKQAIETGLPFVNKDVPRPRLVYIHRCSHVVIEGLHLQNAGFWNLHLYDSEDVLVSHIHVESPHSGLIRGASTDGIDIDMCRRVVVTDSYFCVDDDCICIKGGKGKDAPSLNKPTEDILIQHCEIGFGHGAVTIGSEACRVRNVLVKDLTVSGENQLVRFKFREDTDQYFSHITFDTVTMQGGVVFAIRPWVSRQDETSGQKNPSVIEHLCVRNITARNVIAPGCIFANPPSVRIRDLHLEHIQITTSTQKKHLSRHDQYESEGDPDSLQIESKGVESCMLNQVIVNNVLVEHL